MQTKTQFSFDAKKDLQSGLIVFLIALPLCLGIALASGAPLFSGLIAGIVEGIVISLFSGSPLSVSGPAAGLTVIVLDAIQKLGSFETFLVAVMLAGTLQILLGVVKAGSIANYFPSNVIKGMLAAIGLILILKQIPHAFGYDKDPEGDFVFEQPDHENSFTELVNVFYKSHWGAIIISAVSLLILFIWSRPKLRFLNIIPSGLTVVVVGTILSMVFASMGDSLALTGDHLVNIPESNPLNEIRFPDLSKLLNITVVLVALKLAFVGSLETLLSVEAIDKLDPKKRVSNNNKELVAQGIGNMASGILGGLPITAVIVRGSANINAGAQSRWSSFVHGILLLLCILLIPGLINYIPLSCLAILLIVVGYKLCNIQLIKSMYKAGWEQFIPFIVTIVAIVLSDLLIGIAIGMAVSVIFLLKSTVKHALSFDVKNIDHNGNHDIVVTLSEQVPFLSKASLGDMLEKIPDNSHVLINATKVKFIDHDVLEILYDFQHKAVDRNIQVSMRDVPAFKPLGSGH